ncbi:hypothetical protein C6502_04150 [Candidatus Poribacteria bacterium]|nr:MAG: hypothetical protein C6502_04150 [Candidatus Poribacteria bacterium]
MENNPTSIPYIHHSGNRYRFSESLQGLSEDLVKQPFENHPPTPAWEDQVRDRDTYYHREIILDQGRANFDEPFNGLSPADQVLLYCVYYMPMHLVSSYHISVHTRFFKNLVTSVDNKVVFIDFGCGPLTSGIAFWAFTGRRNITYLGIDSSQAMCDKAKEINQYGPKRYRDPFFSRFELMSYYTQLTGSLDNAITVADKTLIIFNFCYFLASRTLDINDLSDIMVQIVERYRNHNMCIVYQNPVSSSLSTNWRILKANLSRFRSIITQSNIQQFRYYRLTDGFPHDVRVYYDILYKD